ncbi:hypothetical protein ACFLS1_10880 [Verrucomicrobiota bacterium]
MKSSHYPFTDGENEDKFIETLISDMNQVINDTLHFVQTHRETEISVSDIPLDDEESLALINRGDITGILPMENENMLDLVRKMPTDNTILLANLIALCVPYEKYFLDEYLNRECLKTETTYPHPKLKPLLKNTYGLIFFKEDAELTITTLSGFDKNTALAMVNKMREATYSHEDKELFIQACKKVSDIDDSEANSILDKLQEASQYWASKKTSLELADLCLKQAYLKTHYPLEFLSACMYVEKDMKRLRKLADDIDLAM